MHHHDDKAPNRRYCTSMLGLFDTGIGGLTIQRAIHERFPDLSTVYFGDSARAPYGTRSQEEIFQFTLEGVRFLFDFGVYALSACTRRV